MRIMIWLRCLVMAAVLGAAGDSGQGDPWKTLSERAAQLNQAGQYSEAVGAAEEAVKAARDSFGNRDPRTAGSLETVAVLYFAQGRFPEAIPPAQEALAIFETQAGWPW